MLLLNFEVKLHDLDGAVIKTESRSYCSELRLNEALMILDRDIVEKNEAFTLLSVSCVDFLNDTMRRLFNVRRIETGAM